MRGNRRLKKKSRRAGIARHHRPHRRIGSRTVPCACSEKRAKRIEQFGTPRDAHNTDVAILFFRRPMTPRECNNVELPPGEAFGNLLDSYLGTAHKRLVGEGKNKDSLLHAGHASPRTRRSSSSGISGVCASRSTDLVVGRGSMLVVFAED